MRQLNRRSATKKGVLRRLRDVGLEGLTDRRQRRGRRYRHRALVMALMLGMVAALRSLRQVEAYTAMLSHDLRRAARIPRRISDTKLRDELLSMESTELREGLHRQVKAEHRRGNLAPSRLSIGLVAIDGKCLGKLDDWDHPDVQAIRPDEGIPYGLARVQRAHLVSAEATVCIDERPLPGKTNEVGAVCDFTSELIATYKRTELFEAIIADAGNCSLKHASLINRHDLGYILAIKEQLGEIHQEAIRTLSSQTGSTAEREERRREKGMRVVHRIWRRTIPGYLRWKHARQLIRVERITIDRNGALYSEGNRYFVTNLPSGRLDGCAWLQVIRAYWRIENNGNWTADAVWNEDARRTPWCRVPTAVYALSLLRMIAMNVIAVLRAFGRVEYTSRPLSWTMVLEQVRALLIAPEFAIGGNMRVS